MNIAVNIQKAIKFHRLNDNEYYCLYLLRRDGWPFGYIGCYTNANEISELVMYSNENPDIAGIWVTKESGDGTQECDIFKVIKG